MARILSEGSGKGAEPSAAQSTILNAGDTGNIQLSENIDISAIELSRQGQSLVMTTPDGHVYVVENYFLGDEPVITSASGAILSPGLVQSFLKTTGDVQVAANEQANDHSPVGEITEVTGNATITHADGTHEKISSGTHIFEGDIVETDAHGAVNIKFVDDSTFAVSENARLAVDDFSFNASDQSGTTGLSILRGVFMFTSGLIGRENPDSVHLETPVGSIGIRGTIIGGHIEAGGHTQISVLEGAIVVRNGAGEQILSNQFETVQLTSFNAPMTNIGALDAGQMTQSYGAVRSVAPTLFTSIDDTAHEGSQNNSSQQGQNQDQGNSNGEQKAAPEGQQQQQQQAPAGDAPAQPAQGSDQRSDNTQTQTGEQAQAQTTQTTTQPAQPTASSTMAETPVFQTLNTGSNLATTTTAVATPPPSPAAAPATASAATIVTAPPPPAATRTETTSNGTTTTNTAANTPPPSVIAPVNHAPSNITLANNSIAENAVHNAFVGKATGIDPDPGNTLSYALTNNAGGRFLINSANGEIHVDNGSLLNYEAAASHGITVRVTDQNGLSFDQTFVINVTDVNEAIASFSIPTSASIDERPSTVATPHTLAALTIVDSEGSAHNPAYQFAVDSRSATSTGAFTADNRFQVVDDNGVWKLVAKDHTAFDHEAGDLTVHIRLIDGTHSAVVSNDMTLNIGDINEPGSALALNDGLGFSRGGISADSLLSGRQAGAWVGILDVAGDPDTNPAYRPNASQYSITSLDTGLTKVGGGTLTASDFEIIDVVRDDGAHETILKLKNNVAVNFSSNVGFTLGVSVDADQDGTSTGDIARTLNLWGRNDMMALESINGKNGFTVQNDDRFAGASGGAKFASAIAIGDFDGDGKQDLIFGAPLAQNGEGTAQESGGVYGFKMSGFATDTQNGEIRLSALTDSNDPSKGFFSEYSTGSNDSGAYYGSAIASLRRFDQQNGADIAIANPKAGTVEITHGNGTSAIILDELPITATGDALGKAITLASLGDVNGDGLTDLLVGVPDAGKVALVYGGSGTTHFDQANAILTGSASFGASITGVNDFDHDGYADFAVSAPDFDNTATGGAAEGGVYIYYGDHNGSSLTSNATFIKGVDAGDHLGSGIAGAGDFNGDGFGDLLLRSTAADTGRGALYLVLGDQGLKGDTVDISDLNNASANPDFNGALIHWSVTDSTIKVGDSFSGAGDFNGDGFGDVVLDVSKLVSAGAYQHTLYVLYGSATIGTTYNLDTIFNDPAAGYKIVISENTGEHLTLSGGKDINGDGYSDIIVGDPYSAHNDGGSTYDGSATVVYGGNYTGAIISNTTMVAASADKSYVGASGNDTLDTGIWAGNSFHGGGGDDVMTIHAAGQLRLFDGGAGKDILRLDFSAGESTGAADVIDFRGQSTKLNGIEVLEFAAGSKQDTLTLDIRDVIMLLSSSDSHSLVIKAQDTPGAGDENHISLYNDDGNPITNLAGLGANQAFTRGTDVTTDGTTYHSYHHTASGADLFVDTRIADSTLIP